MKTLMLLVASIGAFMVYETIIDGPSWYLEGREPDLDLTWKNFVFDLGTSTPRGHEKRDAYNVYTWKYKNKVLQWEGQVLRVDGDSTEEYSN